MNEPEHSCEPVHAGCVLVVVDNWHVRRMLSLALETAGFRVLAAATLRQVQRRLARARPDALLLNLERSQADGLQVLVRMRARQDLCAVPILFLAGSDTDDFRWEAVRAGADWFALRPLSMIELRGRLAELMCTGRPRLKLIAARGHPARPWRLKPTG